MELVSDTPTGGAEAAELPAPHVPGEPGMWIFLFGELTVFALLFGTFLYARGHQPVLFARSQRDLHRYFGAINTLILLSSSLCVITAVRAMRRGARNLASALIAVAMLCGCAFLLDKGLEWSSLISGGHTLNANQFFLYFFLLTGLHAFHVVVGLAALTVLLVLSRRPQLSKGQTMVVEGAACFWHLVDMLWIVLFALLYLVR